MMSNKEKIVLFDMDGTLTAPRGPVEPKVVQALKRLTKYVRVGIITGSDYDYVLQQMSAAFEIGGVPVDKIDILPCNGTKKYVSTGSGCFELQSSVSMIEEIGEQNHILLLRRCLAYQQIIMSMYEDLPYTGTFLQYRGSLLNWCPIGRDATAHERDAWNFIDNKYNVRKYYAEAITHICSMKDVKVTVALGGSTSLDIYPTGWDKTYGLTHYPNHDIWFVGDRCEEGGNDWHIYEALKEANRSFHIHDPDGTITVINKIITAFKDS